MPGPVNQPGNPFPVPAPSGGNSGTTTGGQTDAGMGNGNSTSPKSILAAWKSQGHYGYIQRFLLQHGYNVGKVDHLWGPRTHSAFNAFMKDISAHNWTAAYHHLHSGHAPASSHNASADTFDPTAGGGGGGFNPNPSMPGASGISLAPISSYLGSVDNKMLDPNYYAALQSGMQFDPQINQLNQNLANAKAMSPKIAAAIKAAYAPAQALAGAQAGQDMTAASSDSAAITQTAKQLAAMLGGAGGASIANTAANQVGSALNQGANEASLDRSAAADLSQQVGQASARTQNEYAKAQQAILQSLADTKGQKGAAFKQALLDGSQLRGQLLQQAYANRGADLNQQALAKMSGLNIQGAELANQQALQNLGVQAQQTNDASQINQAQLATMRHDLAQSGKHSINDLSADDLAHLDSYLRTGAVDDEGKLTISTGAFRSKIQKSLNALFPDGHSVRARRFRDSIVAKYS